MTEPLSYPAVSRAQAWELCVGLLEKDVPVRAWLDEISAKRDAFDLVFDRIAAEHRRTIYKYHRTAAGEPILNPLYLDHYGKLLHAFARELYLRGEKEHLLDCLFLSVRSRCCLDMFYQVEMGPCFLPIHAFATILGRAAYGSHFVVMQQCTVGNNKGVYPVIGDGVILHPGATVLGNCRIGDNVRVGAGALIIDTDIPPNSVVLGRMPDLVIRPNPGSNIAEFFEVTA